MANNEQELLLTKRHESTSSLVVQSKDSFYRLFVSIYNDAKKLNKSRRFLFRDIQLNLKGITLWTEDKLRYECTRFKNFEEIKALLELLFDINKKLDGYSLPRPDTLLETFVRETTLSISREMWNKIYVLYELFECRMLDKHQESFEKIINTNIKIITRKITSISTINYITNTNFDSIQTETDLIHPNIIDLIDITLKDTPEIQICVEPDIPIPIKKEEEEIIKIIDTIVPRKKHKLRNVGSTDAYLKRYKPKNVSVKKMMSDVFFR